MFCPDIGVELAEMSVPVTVMNIGSIFYLILKFRPKVVFKERLL